MPKSAIDPQFHEHIEPVTIPDDDKIPADSGKVVPYWDNCDTWEEAGNRIDRILGDQANHAILNGCGERRNSDVTS